MSQEEGSFVAAPGSCVPVLRLVGADTSPICVVGLLTRGLASGDTASLPPVLCLAHLPRGGF